MGWIIAYLVSLVLIPIVIISVSIKEDESFKIPNGKIWRRALAGWLFWPIFIAIVCPYIGIKEHINGKLKEAANEVKYRTKLSDNKFDRSDIVVIAEQDLKLLLRAYRKKLIELSNPQVEIIRDELMHRTAENQLLR